MEILKQYLKPLLSVLTVKKQQWMPNNEVFGHSEQLQAATNYPERRQIAIEIPNSFWRKKLYESTKGRRTGGNNNTKQTNETDPLRSLTLLAGNNSSTWGKKYWHAAQQTETRSSEPWIVAGSIQRCWPMGKLLDDWGRRQVHTGFAVHLLKMWSPFMYTKYTRTRAVWLPDGRTTSKEGALPVRSNYKLFLS